MSILHIIIAIILVIVILIQEQGAGLSSSIGGSEFYGTRRGLEKKIFYFTVVLGTAFIVLGILRLIFH